MPNTAKLLHCLCWDKICCSATKNVTETEAQKIIITLIIFTCDDVEKSPRPYDLARDSSSLF